MTGGGGLEARIAAWLAELCEAYPDRHVGGPGNRAATDLFARVASDAGFAVEVVELPCVEWERAPSWLDLGGERLAVNAGPYSLRAELSAPLREASTVEQLEAGDFGGSVLLLHGELVREQLMAKNFAFYNPASHKRIVAALEAQAPAVILAATGTNPDLAGGMYPFPLIEDGDFDIPNAYAKDLEGERLLTHLGERASVRIDSRRRTALAAQPVARKAGSAEGRLLFFAHVDGKDGTPAALDNATGVAALFGMMELLADRESSHTVEVVPLNGEDYYAATGQMWWLAENEGRLGDVALGVNVDGAGFAGAATAVSYYGVPDSLAATVRGSANELGFVEGPQWPQGDHSMLVMNDVPAVAVTSENAFFVASTVAHTEADTLANVDVTAVARVARFLAEVAQAL